MAGRKKKSGGRDAQARRGMRRSIRYEAVEQTDEDGGRRVDPERPPEILLRKLSLAEAMERLEFQLRAYASRNRQEVLVVHGKGQASAGGIPVLGPEVRRWCSERTDVVASWSEAPARWGGAGAIVVRLRLE
jgi:DNA-nicking Smr family endonuclease